MCLGIKRFHFLAWLIEALSHFSYPLSRTVVQHPLKNLALRFMLIQAEIEFQKGT